MDELRAFYADWARMLLQSAHTRGGDYARPVFGEGARGARLMLIGEAPGGDEAKAGRPFVGKAGRQLDALLACAGIDRNEVFITNAVKYRPTNVKGTRVSNRTPSRAEWREGLPLLRAEIGAVCPWVIATLGNTPLCALMCLAQQDACVSIGERHGQAYDVRIEERAYTLFPLYHPASVIYNPALSAVLKEDLCRLGALLREKEGAACKES